MSIIVDVNLLTEGEKEYIEIVVPPYPVAISCKGVYYYRSGSTMQTLSGPELESFILRKRGASWDSMPLPGFTVNDIDDELVQKFKFLAVKKGRVDRSVLDESKESLMGFCSAKTLINGILELIPKLDSLNLMQTCAIKTKYMVLFWSKLTKLWKCFTLNI